MPNIIFGPTPSSPFPFETLIGDESVTVPERRQYLIQGQLELQDSSEVVLNGNLVII